MCLDAFEHADRGGCVVYSVGISDDSSFDRAITARYPGCQIFAFDPTIGRPTGYEGFGPRIHFYAIWLVGSRRAGRVDEQGHEHMTLSQIMAMLGHERIDVLKMDVEGSEWAVFTNWEEEWLRDGTDACPPFRALSAELHFPLEPEVQLEFGTHAALHRLRSFGFVPFSRLENWRYCSRMQHGETTGGEKAPESFNCLEVGWVMKGGRVRECYPGA